MLNVRYVFYVFFVFTGHFAFAPIDVSLIYIFYLNSLSIYFNNDI